MKLLGILVVISVVSLGTAWLARPPQRKMCPSPSCPRPPRVRPAVQNPKTCAQLDNELFIDGGPDCQQTCATLFVCCTVRHIAPVRECYCKPGYARAKDGLCIPIASWECIHLACRSLVGIVYL